MCAVAYSYSNLINFMEAEEANMLSKLHHS